MSSTFFRQVIWLLVLVSAGAVAQELNCSISVDHRALDGTQFDFLDDLRDDLHQYVNNRSWTDDRYQTMERINCSMQIIFRENRGTSEFDGEIIVQASRPIYGTAQRSQTLIISDDSWTFEYTRGKSLSYNPNTFDSFTSTIDFYVFLILGYDYDTFAELGGTRFFEEAQQIASRGQAATGIYTRGWGVNISNARSRMSLVQELLDPRFQPLRQAHFRYHFEVLDHFVQDPEAAWEAAIEVLASLHEMYLQLNQRRYATDVFFISKYEELVALFQEAPARNQAYDFLSDMDPAHLNKYDELVTGG